MQARGPMPRRAFVALAAAITTRGASAVAAQADLRVGRDRSKPVWRSPADVPGRHRGGDRQAPVCRDEGAPIAEQIAVVAPALVGR